MRWAGGGAGRRAGGGGRGAWPGLAWWAAAGAGLTLLAGRLPLLDGLTYELAVVVGIVAYVAGAWAGAKVGAGGRGSGEAQAVGPGPGPGGAPGWRGPGAALGGVVAFVLAAAMPPAVAGLLAGCRVERGVPLYFLVTLPAGVLGVAVGLLGGVGSRGARRPRLTAARPAVLVVLGSVALTLYEALAGPRSVFHNLLLGPITVSGYLGFDPLVRIASHDLLHRLASLLLAALCLALAAKRAAGPGRAARTFGRLAMASALGLLLLVASGDRAGFGSGRSRVERALAGRHRTAHFELRFRAGSPVDALAERLGRAAEWDHSRMAGLLDAPAGGTISVFVYADDAERLELTGAAGYLFAKPWLGEVHTELGADGQMLAFAHELTHVLMARFGLPGIGVSARYGLIEGVAEGIAGGYAERPWRHEPVAAAMRHGLLPPAAELVGNLGFAGRSAGVSYQAAASLCGFLAARHGPRPLTEAYAWGDFEGAFGRPLVALDEEWRDFLAGVEVGPRALAASARSYDRRRNPPFFRRACARLGLREPGAPPACPPWTCAGEGPAFERGLSELDAEAAVGAPLERDRALARLAVALVRAGRVDEARLAVERRLELGLVTPTSEAALRAGLAEPDLLRPAMAVAGMLAPGDGGLDLTEAETAAGARRVLAAAQGAARGPGFRRLGPIARALGGCAVGLDDLEGRVLVAAARAARIAGETEAARSLGRQALTLSAATGDTLYDASLESGAPLPGLLDPR